MEINKHPIYQTCIPIFGTSPARTQIKQDRMEGKALYDKQ